MTKLIKETFDLIREFKSQPQCRKSLIENMQTNLTDFLTSSDITSNEAIEGYHLLAKAAALYKYAINLFSIEEQAFFPCLADWRNITDVQDLVEFNEKGEMRLLKSLDQYSTEDWQRFRRQQQIFMKSQNLTTRWQVNDKAIFPCEKSLYPLPFSGFWNYPLNRSVDMIFANENAEFTLVCQNDRLFLPAGGMLNLSERPPQSTLEDTLINEYLEEMEGDLWQKAHSLYNNVTKQEFHEIAESTWTTLCSKFPALKPYQDFWIKRLNETHALNSEHLKQMIHDIDDWLKDNTDQITHHALLYFRARIQINLIADQLIPSLKNFIMCNAQWIEIEQEDPRVGGGRQISHVAQMSKNISAHLNFLCKSEHPTRVGDDISNGKLCKKTFLESVMIFEKINYSHLAMMANYLIMRLKNKSLSHEKIWQEEFFISAKATLINAGALLTKKIQQRQFKIYQQELKLILKRVNAVKHPLSHPLQSLYDKIQHSAQLHPQDIETLILFLKKTKQLLSGTINKKQYESFLQQQHTLSDKIKSIIYDLTLSFFTALSIKTEDTAMKSIYALTTLTILFWKPASNLTDLGKKVVYEMSLRE